MSQCLGERFDGTPCNSYLYVCTSCDTMGCTGDGCQYQAYEGDTCDGCGGPLKAPGSRQPALV
jgi:hypothetical protein